MPENFNNCAPSIDQSYDNMLRIADSITDVNSKIDDKEISSMIENIANTIANNSNSEFYDQRPDEEVSNIVIPKDSEIPYSDDGVSVYDPSTGTSMITDTNIENYKDEITSKHFDALINGNNTEINVDAIKNMNIFGGEIKKDADIAQIAYLMSRRINGDNIKYDDLPNGLKNIVSQIMASTNTRGVRAANIMNKNKVAKMLIDDFVAEYKKDTTVNMDLDTVLAGFDKEVDKISNEMSSELGNMMIGFDEERRLEIEAAIKKCEESGNTKGVEKLKTLKSSIEDAFSLDKFKEFCKTCKIKKFDIKKPNRYFDYFNMKYISHTNVINDIKMCPTILRRHDISTYQCMNVALCVAFCKYCENMSPDNIDEHTFMYYFIRNIFVLDKINPRGEMYETMDEKSKDFYDTVTSNLAYCIENLINRNSFLNPKFEDSIVNDPEYN